MKTKLFFTVMLATLLTFNGFAQEKELWGLAPTPGYIYKLNQNGENKEIVYNISGVGGYGPGSGGSLLQADNKKLYGMTKAAGTNNMGTVFEYDVAQQQYTILVDFDGTNGKKPETNNLIQASNGKLYGMTPEGGDYDGGVIFEYDLVTNTFTKLIDLHDTLGKAPTGDLYQVDNTDSIIFYGMTKEGGKNNGGVLFKYNLTDSSYRVVKNFDGYYPYHKEFGRHPYGSVMQAENGKIYGLTREGGTHDNGVLFEYDPGSMIFIKKFDFTSNETGKRPKGSLIQAADGKLYGVTQYGGGNFAGGGGNAGAVFSYDITNDTLILRASLGDGVGTYPLGSLVQATSGKMFGTTYMGACSSGGVFCFDPETDTIYRTACNGYPNGNLIEIDAICIETYDTITEEACISYTSPSGNYAWTESGIYTDTVPNADGCDSIITINLTVNTVDVSVTQEELTLTANAEDAQYQWLDCDNNFEPMAGDTNRVFTATSNGHFAVIVTQGSCIDTSDCYTVDTYGIDENGWGSRIKLYPNPTREKVVLSGAEIKNSRVTVFNTLGIVVFEQINTAASEMVLPFNDLPEGVYFVKVKKDDRQKIFKVIRNL